MKTVLQVTGTMDRGGAEVMLMDLVRKLHRDFRFVFLIHRKKGTQPKGDFDDELRSLGCELKYIESVWDIGIKAYKKKFSQLINEIGKVDIVHSHLNSKGGIIAKCARACGIPKIIVHSHAKIEFNGSLIYRSVMKAELILQRRWINRYATDYWACSEEALPSLFTKSHYNSEKAQVIHNAIDPKALTHYDGDTIREELDIPEDLPVVGSVGRIAKVKNYELAADLIAALWDKGHKFAYVVAGRKQDDSCSSYLLEKLGKYEHFYYLGVRGDLGKLYHGMGAYLGTSLREGLGLTAVEAQACGVPCLLSQAFPSLCDIGLGLIHRPNEDALPSWETSLLALLEQKKTLSTDEIINALISSGYHIDYEAARVKKLYLE